MSNPAEPTDPTPSVPADASDEQLVDAARSGDMDAFGTLVERYQDRIFNVVFRMCSHRADAEELTQDAFLRALRRIGQFRGASGFYTWVFRIAVNLTITFRRKRTRRRRRTLTLGDAFDAAQNEAATAELAASRSAGPEEMLVTGETQQLVTRALGQLDEEFRLVLVLRDIEEMDYRAIGEVLDLPVGTVKSRLHRGRLMLRSKLERLLK